MYSLQGCVRSRFKFNVKYYIITCLQILRVCALGQFLARGRKDYSIKAGNIKGLSFIMFSVCAKLEKGAFSFVCLITLLRKVCNDKIPLSEAFHSMTGRLSVSDKIDNAVFTEKEDASKVPSKFF